MDDSKLELPRGEEASMQARLAPFLELNPYSVLTQDGARCVVKKPWNDASLELRFGKDEGDTVAALNSLRLPPVFTGMWHVDSGDMEFIYTPLPVEEAVRERRFTFHFAGKEILCEFGQSSDRLLSIAKAAYPVGPVSLTAYRNLQPFHAYCRASEKGMEATGRETWMPLSFWVRGVEWDESRLSVIAHHLNFYMGYFDRQSPVVIVHEGEAGQRTGAQEERYPFGAFPSDISAREIDPYLLRLWQNVTTGDEFLRFLYAYQILEHRAFYHLKGSVRDSIVRILSSPGVCADIDDTATRIVGAVMPDNMPLELKIDEVLKCAVDPDSVWPCILPFRSDLSKPTEFDGGLVVAAVFRGDEPDMSTVWPGQIRGHLTAIRNALAHARDKKTGHVIMPTRRSARCLRPWLHLIAAIASELMVYRGS